jgi:hypothetical protein
MAQNDRDSILQYLRGLTTENLKEMVRQRDTSRWREEVFAAAERLLAERAGARPMAKPPTGGAPVVAASRPSPAAAPTHESPLDFEEARADAIAIHCSDGRFSQHLERFLSETLKIPRCDRLAVPGGPALLTGRLASYWESAGVENQVRFLIETHALKRIVLVAHEGCGYYARRLGIAATSIEQAQLEDLGNAARRLMHLGGLGVTAYLIRHREGKVAFEAVSAADLAGH